MSLLTRAKGLGVALLAALFAASASSSSSSSSSSLGSAGARLRAALLARSDEDMGGRVVETGGKNRGPIVDQYLANVGQAPGQPWCAATAWTWLRDAARRTGLERVLAIFKPSALAKSFMTSAQAQRPPWWVPASVARLERQRPPPGSFAVWDRSNPPGSSWEGHVGLVTEWRNDGSWFLSREGNSGIQGERATVMDRPLADHRLLGFVVFPEDF